MSACIAARLSIVSSSDSPLLVLEAEMFRLMTSADSRLEAISKVVRVRVEFSKNRLNTLLPRISGTFFTSRSPMPTKEAAVSRMRVTIGLRQAFDGQQVLQFAVFVQLRVMHGRHREGKAAVGGALQDQLLLPAGQRDPGGDEIGGDRQFALAAIDQRRQHDPGRPAVVEQFVDGGARGAAGVQHVVDQQDGGAVDVERDLGRLDLGRQALLGVVVAVERDVDEAEPLAQLQRRRQALGQPGAAGADADDGQVVGLRQAGAHLLQQLRVEKLRRRVQDSACSFG